MHRKATLAILCSWFNTVLSYSPTSLVPYGHLVTGGADYFVNMVLRCLNCSFDVGCHTPDSGQSVESIAELAGNVNRPYQDHTKPGGSFFKPHRFTRA
jgi:hypothetical protein